MTMTKMTLMTKNFEVVLSSSQKAQIFGEDYETRPPSRPRENVYTPIYEVGANVVFYHE